MRLEVFILGLIAWIAAAQDLKITDGERNIDISTQLVKAGVKLTVQNPGQAVGEVTFLLTEAEAEHLADISATADKKKISIKKAASSPAGYVAYTVTLPSKLASGASQSIAVDYVLTQALVPFPEFITQDEVQYVVYNGNAYISSAYPIATQKTTVNCGSGKILSYSTLGKQLGEKVVFGPFTNKAAKETGELRVHYENMSPFIVATTVDRLIEISHWGNIAVEEHIQIVHKGAQLSGPFSRLDFSLNNGPRSKKMACVKEFKTVLPAAARDIYYRDVIGNISSSNVRVRSSSVEVDIRPRFPLFGGWKTNYIIGYNVPSYEYLYNSGDKFILKMRLIDHIYDNMVVEKLTTRIVLPEKAEGIELSTPFTVERRPNEKMATYLDTEGRTVVVLSKESLIDGHIQLFTLKYNWNKLFIWREPLIATAFFFSLFFAVIVYVRFDFQITMDTASDARASLDAKKANLQKVVDARRSLHAHLIESIAAYKETKNEAALDAAKKTIDEKRAERKKKLATIGEELKALSAESVDKLAEIEKVENGLVSAEKAHTEKATKQAVKNSPEDKAWAGRVSDACNTIDNIVASI